MNNDGQDEQHQSLLGTPNRSGRATPNINSPPQTPVLMQQLLSNALAPLMRSTSQSSLPGPELTALEHAMDVEAGNGSSQTNTQATTAVVTPDVVQGQTQPDATTTATTADGEGEDGGTDGTGGGPRVLVNGEEVTWEQVDWKRLLISPIPVVVLFAMHFIWLHAWQLLTAIWFATALSGLNEGLVDAIRKKKDIDPTRVTCVVLLAMVQVLMFVGVSRPTEDSDWETFSRGRYFALNGIVGTPSDPTVDMEKVDFWDLVWMVFLIDCAVRLAVLGAKALTVLAIGSKPPFKRNGQTYAQLEALATAYRTLLPIGIWSAWLVSGGDENPMSNVVKVIYMVLKAGQAYLRIVHVAKLGWALVSGAALYGSYVKRSDMAGRPEDDRVCSICYEDMGAPESDLPVKLDCGHNFCEGCISEWLGREPSCPVCRAAVEEGSVEPANYNGATSQIPIVF